jgi:hypothetical protein
MHVPLFAIALEGEASEAPEGTEQGSIEAHEASRDNGGDRGKGRFCASDNSRMLLTLPLFNRGLPFPVVSLGVIRDEHGSVSMY